ncbi:prostaglandin E synthase 3 isoform X2 [Ischnura elegans]|uniref:prostaglandin E synthase 3 isoform X2 n=1 Tax=Ischnura elegans TaxID=197161 RepID=UPI001ED87C6A|nr:prostaglandin E synthase 3 isoform X2 [Ischnura elegans]
MVSGETIHPPPVMWAQRNNVVFLTICLEDCKEPQIKLENDKVYFHGIGGTDKKVHEVTIEFYKEVDADKSVQFKRDRNIEFMLRKKEPGPYWPHLMKDKKKYHWLKVDFNKWKDEDDSEDELGGNDELDEMMRQMGGLGAGDDGKPAFDDLEPESDDSDDEGLPDLE